jgi:quercetin dioxygenase-like cupin family protein
MQGKENAANSWPWPDELDALAAAGEFHRLLFENPQVRVLRVTIKPGEFVPVHTHRWPSVVQVESSGEFVRRDGKGKVTFDSRGAAAAPDGPAVQWLGPLPPHSVENVGKTEIRLFTVELKEGRPAGI